MIGETFPLGPKTITREDIIGFAREFDPFPFHLDEKAARQSLLGGLSASGWQTGALALRMLVDAFLGDVATMGGLGFDDLKWKRPVMKNDTLSGTATITGLRRSRSNPDCGVLTMHLEVRNQRGETAMVLDLSNLVEARKSETREIGDAAQ